MAIEKLTKAFVRDCRTPGMFGDGKGLWLRISTPDRRSWCFRYTRHGRAHELGLGSVYNVDLQLARKKAVELRALIGQGIDPAEHKRASKAIARVTEANRKTFEQVATEYITNHRASWRSVKHLEQWESSLQNFAFPVIGKLDVAAIDTPQVLACLRPIWDTKITTAVRLRGRLENVLDFATASDWRKPGLNPARWAGHLDHMLADPTALKKKAKTHFKAMAYADLPSFVATLRQQTDVASRALEFAILTAARTGEVVFADWQEIQGDLWVIPASRTKPGLEYRIPLTPRALALLGERDVGRIFPVHHDALMTRLKKLAPRGLTVHGFRSTFSVWCSETTSTPPAIIEQCLGHLTGNEVSRAYQRSDLLDKRRDILTQWAAFCTKTVDI